MSHTIAERVLTNLYPDQGAHAKDHAVATQQLALKTSYEPEYQNKLNNRDRDLVDIAAAGHDVGYSERLPYWSGTQWEHPYGSINKVDALFRQELHDLSPVEIAIVLSLILNHDNTSYSFPALHRLEVLREGFVDNIGTPSLKPGILAEIPNLADGILEQIDPNKYYAMLHVLQEADALLGDPKRTIEFSKSRNIPVLADDGGIPGVGIPMWQKSGAANALLAANRALRDSYTMTGRRNAWRMYQEARRYITELMEQDPRYDGEDNLGELLRLADVQKFIWQSIPQEDVCINQAFGLEVVDFILPDSFSKPVKSKLIDIRKIREGKSNQEKIELLRYLRERIIGNFALDILTQVSGGLTVIADYHRKSRLYTLVPPILRESSGGFTLQSGNEWVEIARENGVSTIRGLLF